MAVWGRMSLSAASWPLENSGPIGELSSKFLSSTTSEELIASAGTRRGSGGWCQWLPLLCPRGQADPTEQGHKARASCWRWRSEMGADSLREAGAHPGVMQPLQGGEVGVINNSSENKLLILFRFSSLLC